MHKIKPRHIILISTGVFILLAVYLSSKSEICNSIRRGENINLLVVGTDIVDYSRHTDTIIFLSYNPKKYFVNIISIPRDTEIDLPGININRVNQIYAYYYRKEKNYDAALNALCKEVSVLLDNRVCINQYLQIDYDAFQKLIDLIGGVKIEIDEPMHYDDNAGNLHIHFSTGMYILNGKNSLEYVRYRTSAGDIGRIYRQQQFLRPLVKSLTNPVIIARVPIIIKIMLENIHTNLTLWDLLNLLLETKSINIENVRMALLPGESRRGYWIANKDEIKHTVDLIYGPDIELPKTGQVTVEVYNASQHSGAALEVTRLLRIKGFDVVKWGNYNTIQKKTIVIDRVGDIRAAQKIAGTLQTEEIFTRFDTRRLIDITVIIGEDYR